MNLSSFVSCCLLLSVNKVSTSPLEYIFTNQRENAPPDCYNGGVWVEGGCACQPDFTGVQCLSQLYLDPPRGFAKKEETIFHRISKRSIEDCGGLGSASGSGSGSGREPEDEISCSGGKVAVNGGCQFVRTFEGKLRLTNTTVNNESTNATLDETLAKDIECVLDRIFGDVTGYLGSEARELRDGNEVGYIVHFTESSTATSSELSDDFKSKIAELRLENEIEFISIQDIDECTSKITQLKHNCDAMAACNNTEGSFICTCDFGFANSAGPDERFGSKCRSVCKHKDERDLCLNGGTCFLTVNGTGICECPSNFQGVRCERDWEVFLNATIGLGAALGSLLVIFVVVTLMLCARNRIDRPHKSNFVELESNSVNGDFTPTNETNEIKGISNPYMSSDEGITVATNKVDEDPDAPEVEDDRL